MEIAVIPTMDCEPPRPEISEHARGMSSSGPDGPAESKRAIEGYVQISEEFGFTPTLFCHPEVAENQRELLLELRADGVCIGLHLHPYKFNDDYRHDLGAYPPEQQQKILTLAIDQWEDALGFPPRYFRGGKFSANDNTVRLLRELGFNGGSLSNVGRVLPESAAVWSGMEPYAHVAHEGFRQLIGDSGFVEVPVLGDRTRPIRETGDAGEREGYEWLYVQSDQYDQRAVVRNLSERFEQEEPSFPAFVFDTHNDTDFQNAANSDRETLVQIFKTLDEVYDGSEHSLVSKTIADVTEEVQA